MRLNKNRIYCYSKHLFKKYFNNLSKTMVLNKNNKKKKLIDPTQSINSHVDPPTNETSFKMSHGYARVL